MQRIAHLLGRWPIALACAAAIAAAALLPGLGSSGLWEPQERQLADRIAPRRELMKVTELDTMVRSAVAAQLAPKPPNQPAAAVPDESCRAAPPRDAVARSLTNRALVFGRDVFGDSDASRRLPLALLGLLTVLATCGIAMRTAGPRAGVLSTLIVLAMPLLALQSRQLTSEIGTAAGGALIVYGLLALGDPRSILDAAIAIASLAAGLAIGFAGGGALLGLLVPIGAVAAAGSLGVPGLRKLARRSSDDTPLAEGLVAIVATVGAIALIGVLAYQLYDLVPLDEVKPGTTGREVLGHAILPSKCWSSALGAIWKPEDDLRYIYDSTFEQIAYGTYPWGLLAPIAMAALLGAKDRGPRRLGALALAWAAGSWIAGEAFQRKVGFTLFAGFPALAIAVGGWLDGVLTARTKDEDAMPAGALLIAAFFALAALDVGKDLQSFSERLSSLTVGSDAIAYPSASRLAFVPTKLWVLIIGVIVALGLTESFAVWGTKLRRAARYGTAVMLGGTVVLAAFWPYVWQPALAQHLSSKAMFDTYLDLRAPGDQLVLMGELGDAPHDYAPDTKPEVVTTREQVVATLGRPNRVFAISPQGERCQLHRELAGKPYYVIDDRNVRSLMLSNKVDGTTDKNPLSKAMLHAEPKDIPTRPKAKIVWDTEPKGEGRIQLLGWDIPKSVSRGSRFQIKVFYKVLKPIGGNWKVLFHFDGPLRFNGDHDPIDGLCQTSTWQPGDYIIDTYTVIAGGGTFSKGPYEVWTGFFTGANPNWKNMSVVEAPGDMRDQTDRVKIMTIDLE